jgi:hypothetical protein
MSNPSPENIGPLYPIPAFADIDGNISDHRFFSERPLEARSIRFFFRLRLFSRARPTASSRLKIFTVCSRADISICVTEKNRPSRRKNGINSLRYRNLLVIETILYILKKIHMGKLQ